jgi:hypothetical protein
MLLRRQRSGGSLFRSQLEIVHETPISKKNLSQETAGRVAQIIRGTVYQVESLSSNPSATKKKKKN